MRLEAGDPADYRGADAIIQTDAREVVALGRMLRTAHPDDPGFARAAYEWVRDRITHSFDAGDRRVTLTATEVLEAGTGLCFAKSHLLASVLRSQGVPTGLCYQRLADGDSFVLHGLVAVHLDGGWHRLDARGNNPAVDAQFSLGEERLAWPVDPAAGEVDYPTVFAIPTGVVVDALRNSDDALVLCAGGLPSVL
ncbi:MAG: transglutaminase family protein [Propionibacteriaceae bacterium]|nr:transglutaminase family protein [Propionibacteriaceae bacterium]